MPDIHDVSVKRFYDFGSPTGIYTPACMCDILCDWYLAHLVHADRFSDGLTYGLHYYRVVCKKRLQTTSKPLHLDDIRQTASQLGWDTRQCHVALICTSLYEYQDHILHLVSLDELLYLDLDNILL
jgi:hypothetical protein